MRSKSIKLLSLIIPVYRQEKTIRRQLQNILGELELLTMPYEVIVVLDGDYDAQYESIKRIRSDRLIVTGYRINRGKGYAVRYGMSKSRGDIIGFLDGGGDLSELGLSMMIEHLKWYNADIIIGSKRHPVSKVNYPWPRRLLSWGYQQLVKVLFGLRVTDTQVGMKMYRKNVLMDVLPRLQVKAFAFDIEILAVASHVGYTRIYEAPVNLDFSGASSVTSRMFWSIILKMLWDTMLVFYRLKMGYYDNPKYRKLLSSDREFSDMRPSEMQL